MLVEDTELSDYFSQSHMRKLLDVDINHLKTLLFVLRVHHRIDRSLDFLGTVLKVVAGTPDATALQRIKITEVKLIESNNKQVEINTETPKKLNKLTETVNIYKIERASRHSTFIRGAFSQK